MKSGIDTIYFPKDNYDDVLELKEIYNDNINVIFVDNYLDIYTDLFKK